MNKIINIVIVIVLCIFVCLIGIGYKFDNNTKFGKFLNSISLQVNGLSCDSVEVKSVLSKFYTEKELEELPQGFTFVLDKVTTLSEKENGKVCKAVIDVKLSDELKSKIITDIDSNRMGEKIDKGLAKYGNDVKFVMFMYLPSLSQLLKETKNNTGYLDSFMEYEFSETDDGKSVIVNVTKSLDEDGSLKLAALYFAAELAQ